MSRFFQGYRPYLALALLCLCLYLPGIASLPPLDRDESRFAQATRQMLETGDYVRIQFQDEIRAKKPVGAYWVQAAFVGALTDVQKPAIWAHRLASVLGALAATLLCFHYGQYLLDRRTAFLGALLLGSCLILTAEAHQAKTDALQLAALVAAQGCLGRFWMLAQGRDTPRRGTALVFWLAIGGGILIKGPIVPLISLFTAIALSVQLRQARWLIALRPISGFLIAAAVVAPWTVAISHATQGAFIGDAVKQDLLPKLLGSQESHGAPPGYFLLLLSVTFWPTSLFLWPALVHSWRERRDPAFRFLLSWLIPAWIMFEIVPTKLPHYTLPTYPALALLTAAAITRGAKELTSLPARLWYLAWGLIGLALAIISLKAPLLLGDGIPLLAWPAALLAVAAAVLPVRLAWRRHIPRAAVTAVLLGLLTMAAIFTGVAPALQRLWVSQRIADAVHQDFGPGAPVAVAGYSEPSLIFLLGTTTKVTSGVGAAEYLLSHPDGLAIVEDRERADFDATLGKAGRNAIESAAVEGINYSRNGKSITLRLLSITPNR